MTIRQMIEAVNTANLVATAAVTDHVKLVWADTEFFTRREQVKTYKDFAKYIREEYVKEVAEKILAYKDYEFGKDVKFEDKWELGDRTMDASTTICFDVYKKEWYDK